MRKAMSILVLLLAALPLAAAGGLQIYFVDVEGGQATLIVSPSGQSMLVDAGWPSKYGPGAERIAAAAKLAGLKQIDYMFLTHYHLDHVGGVPELAAKIPIVTYVDHGPNTETDKMARDLEAAYNQVVAKAKHLVVKPGDRIPIEGLDVEVVTAAGAAITTPVEGGGQQNPACAGVKPLDADPTENAQSAGFLLRYGKFRFVDLGDLTWNKEMALACPNNLLGTVDVYLVDHHGMDISNSPALVDALHPLAAVMNNGARKAGMPKAWTVVRDSPGLEDLWQLHYSLAGGDQHNSPEMFIANPEKGGACQGHWLKLTANADGSFTISNSRNGFTKAYRR
jgi:beta-lactamase superfamily II metal-dependent hydrolase